MRPLADITANRPQTLSLELFPMKTEAGWRKWDREVAHMTELRPDFFSVTYGAGGSTRDGTRRGIVHIQEHSQLPAVAHLTCVGASRDDLRHLLDDYHEAGIRNLLALRGDPPKGQDDWQPHPDGCHYASELLDLINEDGRFGTACAAFPEGHPEAGARETDWQHLVAKLDRGSSLAITQAFFDPKCYFDLQTWLALHGKRAYRIVPGIMPVRSWTWVQDFVTRFCPNTSLPAALRQAMEPVDGDEDASADAGLAYTLDLCRELLRAGAPGLHIYTLNDHTIPKLLVETLRNEGLLDQPATAST